MCVQMGHRHLIVLDISNHIVGIAKNKTCRADPDRGEIMASRYSGAARPPIPQIGKGLCANFIDVCIHALEIQKEGDTQIENAVEMHPIMNDPYSSAGNIFPYFTHHQVLI